MQCGGDEREKEREMGRNVGRLYHVLHVCSPSHQIGRSDTVAVEDLKVPCLSDEGQGGHRNEECGESHVVSYSSTAASSDEETVVC